MQKIQITTIKKGKEGEGEHGHWTLYNMTFPELSIFEQDGTPHKFTKASTFQDISALKPGDLVECEAEISDKGYLNLKKIALLVNSNPSKEPDKGKPELPPYVGKEPRSGQEIGLWWKEAGEMIRAKLADETLTKAYWQQMREVLEIKAQPPEPIKSPVSDSGDSQEGCGIDTEFLKEIMGKLGWTPGKAASWLENRFPPLKRKGTLSETLNLLNKEQKAEFCRAISEMAAGK